MAESGGINAEESAPSAQEKVEDELPWEELAKRRQQTYFDQYGPFSYNSYSRRIPSICNLLLDTFCKCHEGDGCCDNESELMMMKIMIGCALFGPPSENLAKSNKFTGYGKHKRGIIQKIYDKFEKYQKNDKILMAVLYVSLESKGEVVDSVVFRMPNPNYVEGGTDEYMFVDNAARLYKNWAHFLSNNLLPASKYCVPKGGVYVGDSEGNVELTYGRTPAAKLSCKALNIVDNVVGAAGIVASIGSVVVPCIGAVCVLTSTYSIVRSSVALADRGNYDQSIKDREAVRHWLSVLVSALGVGAAGGSGAVKMLGGTGKNLSFPVEKGVDFLKYSSLAVSGASIAENSWTMIEQEKRKKLEILKLIVSIAFLTHSIVNVKTARSLYTDAQNDVLGKYEASLSKQQRKLYEGIKKVTLQKETDHGVGKAKIIRSLDYISYRQEFYSLIRKANKAARKNSQPIKKVSFGDLSGPEEYKGHSFSAGASFAQFLTMFTTADKSSSHSSHFVKPHETSLFSNVKKFLSDYDFHCHVGTLLMLLRSECENWKFGRMFMDIVHIIIDLKNCKSVPEFQTIVERIIDVASELWEEMTEQISSLSASSETDESSTEGELNQDEEMAKIMKTVNFIPNVLCSLSSTLEVEVFHFPTDHRAWGKNGELQPNEYLLIGQNAFGVTDAERANVRHEDDTASVYFEHIGLVTVTSHTEKLIIVVKKFPKICE